MRPTIVIVLKEGQENFASGKIADSYTYILLLGKAMRQAELEAWRVKQLRY